MNEKFLSELADELAGMHQSGLYKQERVIRSPQQSHIAVESGGVINMCANNYLGFANHPDLITAAKQALDEYGLGMASVRFICGTQTLHKQLEQRLSAFLGTEDTILYSSCFDANGGLFESLLGPNDAIVSDQLNHASIIDGVRLCKAKRYRYANNDMAALREQLEQAKADGARYIMIATDGVFSMDGYLANLPAICDLADEFNALLMVDDSHGVGVVGASGRGTHEHFQCLGRIDVLTGTLGKALGGASGGYVSGRGEIVEMLRQRSRPNLFSNALAPAITASALRALDIIQGDPSVLDQLRANKKQFHEAMVAAGFDVLEGEHPITPIMLGDAKVASEFADRMLEKGVYVIAFSYPVVPKEQARIRVQLSAAHSAEDVQKAVDAFIAVKAEMKL